MPLALAPAPPALTFLPPNRIRFGDREATAGATVWLALQALVAAGGRMTMGQFRDSVWPGGDKPTPRGVWSLCHRANAKLTALDSPVRCGVDCGAVVLC